MAYYVISRLKVKREEETGQQLADIYQRPVIIDESHSPETLETAMTFFDQSFLTTKNAQDGWELVGNARVQVITKKVFYKHFDQIDDDITPIVVTQKRTHLRLVIND